ncbi:MAG: ABC transporter permease [Dehalococcoidia bacterium]
MNPTVTLTIAALKMFFRNRQALFWTLFLPLLIMLIFGLLNFGEFSEVDMGVVDEARNEASSSFIDALEASEVLDITTGSSEVELAELEDGDRDMVVVIPTGFGEPENVVVVQGFYGDASQQEAEVGQSVIRGILDDMTFRLTGTPQIFVFESQVVDSRGLEYVDFLVPGIVAMAIMQMGIFSVTFTLIQYRNQGVLRRLQAAPIRPHNFLVGQVITRLTISILQTLVLLGVAIVIFDVTIVGNLGVVLLLALLGGALFISIGFAVSGFAKTEEVGAPVANLIAMPMMFLSGVFFPTDSLPDVVAKVAQYFPLTYLAEGLREVSVHGAGITEIPWQFLGLGVWIAIAFFLASRLFRWE